MFAKASDLSKPEACRYLEIKLKLGIRLKKPKIKKKKDQSLDRKLTNVGLSSPYFTAK